MVVQSVNIPAQLSESCNGFFSDCTNDNLKKCITKGKLVTNIKKTEVYPLYRKDGKKEKSIYRPVNILLNVSKIYAMFLYGEIYNFFENSFLMYQG